MGDSDYIVDVLSQTTCMKKRMTTPRNLAPSLQYSAKESGKIYLTSVRLVTRLFPLINYWKSTIKPNILRCM